MENELKSSSRIQDNMPTSCSHGRNRVEEDTAHTYLHSDRVHAIVTGAGWWAHGLDKVGPEEERLVYHASI